MQRSRRLFIFITLIILCSDALFVWINYQSAHKALHQSLHEELVESRAAFRLAFDATTEMLQQTATLIAADARVQTLFLQGKRAVESEGGGSGGERAAQARQALFELLRGSWQEMARTYKARQLHFHLGPGAVSFLRLHKPQKFGDRLDSVRYTIVDANAKLQPTKGFETGRLYSGIRGVTPVFADDPLNGAKVHAGALEAGTSFPLMFQSLRRHTGTHFAVLLTLEHLQANVWPDNLQKLYATQPPLNGYFIEASSDLPTVRQLLLDPRVLDGLRDVGLQLLKTPQALAVSAFTLRDYLGEQDASRPAAGFVLMWRAADQAMGKFEEAFRTNVMYAVIAFVILECALFVGIYMVTHNLEKLVSRRTGELAKANTTLERRNQDLADSLFRLKQTQANLVESEKMASLGRLVAGVAHEVNTPIGSGLGAISHLADKLKTFATLQQQGGLTRQDVGSFTRVAQRCVDIVLNNLQRATEQIHSFKQVAVDRSSEQPRPFHLRRYIDTVLMSLHPRLCKTPHTIQVHCPADWQITSYPGALSQVLSNLIVNALTHAFAADQVGRIEISAQQCGEQEVELRFSDNGAGIAAAHRQHIFEPFFTTNRENGGSGLGLNIVYNLVTETLGGTITLLADTPVGCTFIVRFPLLKDIETGDMTP
jgi:signal transduction histidine kinase